MKTLILDNYDSFTFNLYQEIGALGGNPVVERNDAVTIDDVRRMKPTHIVISPGPGNPYTKRDVGICEELIDFASIEKIPLLGVCLGHQVLGKHAGATVSRAPSLFHGKASTVITKKGNRLFKGLGNAFDAMRYHSLCVEPATIPSSFNITATTDDGVVMAMEHAELPLFGIQFHPESIGTPQGKDILRNFLSVGSHLAGYRLMHALLSDHSSQDERTSAFNELISLPISSQLLIDCAGALREYMVGIALDGDPIDTCGTGGSGLKTINTSTLTAFIVAAASGKVAKHGNRSASGNCGCFDLLETLGVNITLTPDQERRMFDELGIVFLFAPLHHPALRHVGPLRKAYGKKTLFNLLGPLCNPAGVRRQMIGTGNDAEANLIAEALQTLGSSGSMVVTGHDGLDEVTVTAPTTVRHVLESGIQFQEFSPASLGVSVADPADITGGTPAENVEIFIQIAKGEGSDAHKNLVLVNAAHALLLTDLVQNSTDAFRLASETLASGKVHGLFLRYRDLSHSFSS